MRRTGLAIFITVLLLAALVAGCGAPAAQGPAPKSIVIGALVSMTGGDSSTGQPSRDGYEAGVAAVNANGGVFVKEYNKKIPIELVVLDMETNPEKAIARAEALNSQYKAVAVVGTTLINATADIFEKNKLPVLTQLVALNSVFERGFKYYFTIGKLNKDSAEGFVDVLANLPEAQRPKTMAFAVEQTEFVTELCGFVKQRAESKGIKVVYEGQYAMMSPDMSSIILGAKKANADVFMGAPIVPDAITMLKQMAELEYAPKAIIFNRATDDLPWGKMGGLTDYTLGSPDWVPSLNYPGVKELNELIKAKTGQEANYGSGAGYASILVLAAAIEKAGTLDRTKVRDALASTDMMTVTGPLKFKENGTRVQSVPVVIQWQKGKVELVWPDNMKTQPVVYPRPKPSGAPAPAATVTPSQPVAPGTPIDFKDAKANVGKNVTVTGEIFSTMMAAPPATVLFLGGPMGQGLSIEISNSTAWPVNPDTYKGKTLVVTG
ncbi:MAG: hypothetical protein A2Z02_05970, partial [Chloroflexi bacterium RBG_16_48_7]